MILRKDVRQYDAKQMYDIADAFWLAAKRCDEPRIIEVGWVQRLIVPVIVNYAFACELFIKAMLQKEGSLSLKSGHSLEQLFKKLSDETQQRIIKEIPKCDFKTELNNISLAFQEWRYIYEIEIHSINMVFLELFATALKQEIESRLLE